MDNFTTQPDFSNENPQNNSNPVPESNSGTGNTFPLYYKGGLTPEEFKIKKKIRSTAARISISLLLFFFLSFSFGEVYYLIMSKLGFSTQTAQAIISEPAVMQVYQIAVSSFLFTVPFIIVQKIRGEKISNLVPIKKVEKENFIPLFFIGVAFCVFSNIAASTLSSFFSFIHYEVDFGENPKGFFGVLLTLLSTVAVPALVEEFACRGIVLGVLRKFGDGFAVVVSAAVFGLIHGNFEQIPFAFLVGLVLGFIVVKTNSLLVAMAVHAANNLISVIFSYLSDFISQNAENICYIILLCVLMLLGIFTLYFTKNTSEVFKIDTGLSEVSEKKKYKWFFSSAWIIVFIVICGLESIMYFFI